MYVPMYSGADPGFALGGGHVERRKRDSIDGANA